MGLLSGYVDALPDGARDRLIEAQDWCVAGILGTDGARCLLGHAEDWAPFAAPSDWWEGWVGAGSSRENDFLCSPAFFAFRRMHPGDRDAYRARVERWGIASEARIGARFDRLCARLGIPAAVRMVKARAARDHDPRVLSCPRQRRRRARA